MNLKKVLNPLCVIYALYLKILHLFFRFDKWHIKNNYRCRNYKKILVQNLNALPIEDVSVEIGGGLGEIVGRLKTNTNVLIDLDCYALKAIKFIPFVKIDKFIHGSFEKLLALEYRDIDLLIMVNWPHGIKEEILEANLEKIFQVKNVKFIVVDILSNPWPGSYKHSYQFLKKLGYNILKILDDGEGIRKFVIFAKMIR